MKFKIHLTFKNNYFNLYIFFIFIKLYSKLFNSSKIILVLLNIGLYKEYSLSGLIF